MNSRVESKSQSTTSSLFIANGRTRADYSQVLELPTLVIDDLLSSHQPIIMIVVVVGVAETCSRRENRYNSAPTMSIVVTRHSSLVADETHYFGDQFLPDSTLIISRPD